MVRPEDMPWQSTSGAIYDSGDYEACLRMAAEAIGYDEHVRDGPRPARGRALRRRRDRLVRRAHRIRQREVPRRHAGRASAPTRASRCAPTAPAAIDVYTGVSTFGVGSETTFAQILAEVIGVDFDAIRVHAGDTAASPLNTGGFASRTLIAAAGALRQAGEELRAKILRIAAFALEAERRRRR